MEEPATENASGAPLGEAIDRMHADTDLRRGDVVRHNPHARKTRTTNFEEGVITVRTGETNCVKSTGTVQSRRRPTAIDLKDQPERELANNYQQAHSTGKGVKVLINTIEVPAKGTDRCKGEPATGYPCLDNSKCSTIKMSDAGDNSPLKDYGNGNLWAGGTEVLYDTKKIHPGCSCVKKHDGFTDSEGDRSQPSTRDWGRSWGSLRALALWIGPARHELFKLVSEGLQSVMDAVGPEFAWIVFSVLLVPLVLLRCFRDDAVRCAIAWCKENRNPRSLIGREALGVILNQLWEMAASFLGSVWLHDAWGLQDSLR